MVRQGVEIPLLENLGLKKAESDTQNKKGMYKKGKYKKDKDKT
jgi:hypothetical protein